MQVYINWRIWGLPIGWARGVDQGWKWALSVGPVHLVVQTQEQGDA